MLGWPGGDKKVVLFNVNKNFVSCHMCHVHSLERVKFGLFSLCHYSRILSLKIAKNEILANSVKDSKRQSSSRLRLLSSGMEYAAGLVRSIRYFYNEINPATLTGKFVEFCVRIFLNILSGIWTIEPYLGWKESPWSRHIMKSITKYYSLFLQGFESIFAHRKRNCIRFFFV